MRYIDHRAGSKMRHIDAHSRNTIMCAIPKNDFLQKIAAAQQNDERLNAISDILKENPFKNYKLSHGILYKHFNNNLVIVVSHGMKSRIIKEVRERDHFHYQKILQLIEKEYYIDNLQNRITRHVTNCIRCILAEKKRGKGEGLLNPIPKNERLLHQLHIGHLGSMQATKKTLPLNICNY